MSWVEFDKATNEDGETTKLGDLEGKVLILDFWATYCPPCIEEIPHLNELQAKYADDGFQVIGLHVGGEEDRPSVPAFVKRLEIQYPVATPELGFQAFVFQKDTAIPQTFVINRDGSIAERFVGYDLRIKSQLDRAVERAISKETQ